MTPIAFSQRLVKKIKILSDSILLAYPPKVGCNLCGWQGKHFSSDDWHPYTICPRCGSQVRHRLLAATLGQHPTFNAEAILVNKRVLHIAPEKIITQLIQQYTQDYVTADFLRRDVDLVLDITQMTPVADHSFDVFLACDVLEHVTDDQQALREIHRILKPNGLSIFTIPQADHRQETLEDPTVNSPADREKYYGQSDHVRLYGADIAERITAAGFNLSVVDENSFNPDLRERHTLFPPILSGNPLATNYRKIYFAQKS